jgi:hypothetical protein
MIQTDMTFSQALRLGSTLVTQYKRARHPNLGYACALGAAEVSVSSDAKYQASDIWPILTTKQLDPITMQRHQMDFIVVSLNDDSGWTFNQIADWAEKIEQSEAAKLIPQEATEQELVTA